MAASSVIAIDAMGGDLGVSATVPGLALALKHLPGGVRFLLHGDQAVIGPELSRSPELARRSEVRHTDKVIASDEKPASAVRRGKGASMWNALESVKSGEAAAAVSCGSTGSLMAIARLVLRMSVPMDRPPLVVPWPGLKGVTTFLDAGANIDCDAERLVEFAILGEAYHRVAYGVEKPRVGILNVGSEDMKGHDEVQQAHALLRSGRLDIAYHGFVEGDDLSTNLVDVVVTDGFTGNVALRPARAPPGTSQRSSVRPCPPASPPRSPPYWPDPPCVASRPASPRPPPPRCWGSTGLSSSATAVRTPRTSVARWASRWTLPRATS